MARMTPGARRFLQFCVVGASGVLVNLAVFWAASGLLHGHASDDLRFLLSNIAGFVVSVLSNFVLNDAWTWRDRRHEAQGRGRRFLQFGVVAGIAGGVQVAVASVSRRLLPEIFASLGLALWVDTGAVLVGIGVGTVINFALNNLWTFRVRSPG